MRITLIQTAILWEDKLKNLENLGVLVSSVPSDSEIVLLPEMFNTGFSMNPEKLSEPHRSLTFDWMLSLSQKGNFGICGSYIIKENNHFYNRLTFIAPTGESWHYDKRHLFSPGNEDKLFTPGKQRIVFNFRNIRIFPGICYDLRFPVWSRNRNDYDLFINSANWPESRREVWLTLLKARAIENVCFVAGVNRIGIDGEGNRHCGDSMIIGPRGEVMASGPQNEECLISCKISTADLWEFRSRFPVLKDADRFRLEI